MNELPTTMEKQSSLKQKPPIPGKEEGNKYDKILKEGLETSAPALIRVVLKMQVNRLENLPEIRVQTTTEVEPDYGRLAFTDEFPEGAILLLELEAKDEKGTDDNMLYLVGAERKKFKKPVDLRMIYLRPGRPKHITGKVNFCGLNFEYPVYFIEDYSYREFLYSDKPEEVVLSILANRENLSGEEIVDLIVERLIALRGKKRELYKFINQLKVLSVLRNLQTETIKKVNSMIVASKEFIAAIQQDTVFIMGMEKGMEKGIEKGMEEGMEKGIEKGMEKGMEKGKLLLAITGICNMTRKSFDAAVIADLLNVPEAFVKDIQEQFKLEPQIVAALQKPRATVLSVAHRLKVSQLLVQVIKDALKK